MKFPLKMVPPFGDMLIFGGKFSIKKFLVVLSLKVRSPGLISRQNSYMSTLKKGDQDSKGNLHLNQQTFFEGNIYVSFSWEYSQCFRKKDCMNGRQKTLFESPPRPTSSLAWDVTPSFFSKNRASSAQMLKLPKGFRRISRSTYFKNHPRTWDTKLIPMVSFRPLRIGLWDPFMACKWGWS